MHLGPSSPGKCVRSTEPSYLDWQEHCSGYGKKYYYNKRTKQPGWEKPACRVDDTFRGICAWRKVHWPVREDWDVGCCALRREGSTCSRWHPGPSLPASRSTTLSCSRSSSSFVVLLRPLETERCAFAQYICSAQRGLKSWCMTEPPCVVPGASCSTPPPPALPPPVFSISLPLWDSSWIWYSIITDAEEKGFIMPGKVRGGGLGLWPRRLLLTLLLCDGGGAVWHRLQIAIVSSSRKIAMVPESQLPTRRHPAGGRRTCRPHHSLLSRT